MRILIIANHELTLYNFRQEFLKDLVSNGFEVFLALPKGKFDSLFKEIGCQMCYTQMSQYGMNPLKELKMIPHLKKIVTHINPDIILTYTIKANIYGGIAAQLCKKPYIATITGLGSAFEKGGMITRISTILYKWGLRKSQVVFFQNRANSDLFDSLNIAKGKHLLISGSGVNLSKHKLEKYPDENPGVKFLFVGRVTHDKGISELFEAFCRLKENVNLKNVTIDLLGNIESDCLELAREGEVKGIWRCLGRHENVHDYLSEYHAIILPSYHEGMANVLLEAAATGRPILASKIPGCQEAIINDVSGISFEAHNADALYQAIIYFLGKSPAEREEMGMQGRKYMEQEFDRDKVNSIYIAKIKQVLSDWQGQCCDA